MNTLKNKIFIITALLFSLTTFNACNNEVQKFLLPFFPIRNVYVRKNWEFKDMQLNNPVNNPESILIKAPSFSMTNFLEINDKSDIHFPESIEIDLTITNSSQDQCEIIIPETFTCVVNNREKDQLPFGDCYIIGDNGGRVQDITENKTIIIQGKTTQKVSINIPMPEAKEFLKIKYLSLFFENPSTKQKGLVIKLKKYLSADQY